jgi:hypothetical protein
MIRKDTPHRFPPKSLPRADRAWKHFESGLAHVLPDLARGDCLIVSHRTADIFVQFVGDGRDGMRAEAISNDYVTKGRRLSAAATRALVQCGWNRPTHSAAVEDARQPGEGSPNFYLDLERPVPFAQLAAMAVKSLREVYKVRLPGELQYNAFDDDDAQIRFPALKLRRQPAEKVPALAEVWPGGSEEWRIVLQSDQDDALIIDRNDEIVASVSGEDARTLFSRAWLIASAPALRDAAKAAVPLLGAFASSRRGRLAARASRIVSEIENAVTAPALPLRGVAKLRRSS